MDLRTRISSGSVFYDVDTQNDFMHKEGSLYVPNAESIIPNIEKLTAYARKHESTILAGSVDKHYEQDAELKHNGGPFPDHCMSGTDGQKKIMETLPISPAYIPNKRMRFYSLENLIGDKREIFFEKQHYDVFTNPNIEKVLENTLAVVVYGVATDYCVKAAVLGFRELEVMTFVVEDAIAGVTEEGSKKAIRDMKKAGALFVKTNDVVKGNLVLVDCM